jgi:hypothetical protein
MPGSARVSANDAYLCVGSAQAYGPVAMYIKEADQSSRRRTA